MKIYFSEIAPDYNTHTYPYHIWARKEGSPACELFLQGFLPISGSQHGVFYLTRSTRVNLSEYVASSENRRILKKFPDIEVKKVHKSEFKITDEWFSHIEQYTSRQFSNNVFGRERVERLLANEMVSHLLLFYAKEELIGMVTLYDAPQPEENSFFHYSYAFYLPSYIGTNLGAFMMTTAVEEAKKAGRKYLYLGTCYSKSALYKSQYKGFEFFTGVRWSQNLSELKFLIERKSSGHLLSEPEYLDLFYEGKLEKILGI